MTAPGSRWRLPALAGLSALALLPLLPLVSSVLPPFRALEQVADHWFDLHCHRDPARTLHWLGVPLAVCARCSGIYFGLGLGAALRRPHLSPRALRLWLLGAAALMLLDVLLEARGSHAPWSIARLLTGTLLAYPVGTALGSLVSSNQKPAVTTDN